MPALGQARRRPRAFATLPARSPALPTTSVRSTSRLAAMERVVRPAPPSAAFSTSTAFIVASSSIGRAAKARRIGRARFRDSATTPRSSSRKRRARVSQQRVARVVAGGEFVAQPHRKARRPAAGIDGERQGAAAVHDRSREVAAGSIACVAHQHAARSCGRDHALVDHGVVGRRKRQHRAGEVVVENTRRSAVQRGPKSASRTGTRRGATMRTVAPASSRPRTFRAATSPAPTTSAALPFQGRKARRCIARLASHGALRRRGAQDFFGSVAKPIVRDSATVSSRCLRRRGRRCAGHAARPGRRHGSGTAAARRRGEVAREILLYRDWLVMHLNGAPWFVQPPLYFWLAAAFARILGMAPFALRLPSALATIVMAGAVGYVVTRRQRAGRLAVGDRLVDCLDAGIAWGGWRSWMRCSIWR